MPVEKDGTTRVTTRRELDAALKTANRIVVEGDDDLLRYAASLAGRPPAPAILAPAPALDMPLGGLALGPVPPAPAALMAEVTTTAQASVAASPARSRRWIAWMLVAVLLAAGGITLYLARGPASEPQRQSASREGPEALAPPVEAPAPERNGATPGHEYRPTFPRPEPAAPANAAPAGGADLVQLGWVAVALAGISAVYLLGRQAIAGGRNVEISWKVTERVSGRVVITRAQSRAARHRTA